MNIIAAIIGLVFLVGLIVAAVDYQNQEDRRLTKRLED